MPAAQVLQVTPKSELQFHGPFDRPVTSLLKLRNPSDANAIAFRMRTTVPKSYCVRPNSGIVLPQGEVQIAITLQPAVAKSDQSPDEGSGADGGAVKLPTAGSVRHRFMIQSLVVRATPDAASAADGVGGCLENLWNSASPFEVMNSRLTVTMIPAKSLISADQEQSNCGDQEPIETGAPPQQHLNDSNSELRRLQCELRRLQRENVRLCEQELQLRMSAVKESIKSRYGLNRSRSRWQLQDSRSGLQIAVVSIGSFLLALITGLAIGKLYLQK